MNRFRSLGEFRHAQRSVGGGRPGRGDRIQIEFRHKKWNIREIGTVPISRMFKLSELK